jgi:TonB family protein
MLRPTLDALAFLHGRNLVHGQLKPPNILVVDDQLKLASDTIRPAGAPRAGTNKPSPYDPPEAVNGRIAAAGDIWALGITLVEALTQRPPVWPDKGSENVSLPAGLPPTFAETIGRCLSSNPADRPTVLDLEGEFNLAPPAATDSKSQPVERITTRQTAAPRKPPKQRLFVSIIAVLLVVLAAAWTGSRLLQRSPNSQRPASPTGSRADSTEMKPAPWRPASPPSERPVQPLPDASPAVLQQEIPNVPRSASRTIHGRINVTVRVTVDRSGTVVGEILEKPGPSKYFSRLATTAAKQWKFAPADNRDDREWLLWFEFSRDGTTGHATSPQP